MNKYIGYDDLTDLELNCAVARELGWKPSKRKDWTWFMPGSDIEIDITYDGWADTVQTALQLSFTPYSLKITRRPDGMCMVTAYTDSDMLAEMEGWRLARLISVQWLNLKRLMS